MFLDQNDELMKRKEEERPHIVEPQREPRAREAPNLDTILKV